MGLGLSQQAKNRKWVLICCACSQVALSLTIGFSRFRFYLRPAISAQTRRILGGTVSSSYSLLSLLLLTVLCVFASVPAALPLYLPCGKGFREVKGRELINPYLIYSLLYISLFYCIGFSNVGKSNVGEAVMGGCFFAAHFSRLCGHLEHCFWGVEYKLSSSPFPCPESRINTGFFCP